VEERWREIEARLEPPLLIFALLTIPAIALEYGAQDQHWHAIGIVLNWMIWLAFVAEVVIMLRVVPDRGRVHSRHVSSPPKAYATPQCSR
jgi:hypothetical protein